MELGGASRDSSGFGAMEEGLTSTLVMETFTSFSYFQGASHLTFPLLVSASLGLSFSGKYSGFLHRQREEEFLDYRERGWKFGGSVFSLSLISIHPISVVSDPSSS